jgi:RNA polymerase sigma-70 factor (ECF subfamily)
MHTDPDPDAELMLLVQGGDVRSFERLFQRHAKPLCNFVRRFIGSAAVAEEWTQEIFLKVYRARERWEPRARFRTFLYRVATNHCLNELRRGVHRAQHESLDGAGDASDERPARELAAEQPSAHEIVDAGRLSEAVESAITALPESQRAALLLLRYEGMSYDEIAAAMELSIPAVKSLLNRAKTSLRERLQPFLGAPDEL